MRPAIPALALLLAGLAAPSHAQVPEWRLSPTPTVSIGLVDGPKEYLFARINAAVRLSDGRIVVATSPEIRYFDRSGRHLLTRGGGGSGPGEYSFINQLLRLPGDTVVAVESARRRRSWYDASGAFIRTQQLRFQTRLPMERVQLLPGDRFLTMLLSEDPGPRRGTYRPSQTWVVSTFDGEARTLGQYAGFLQSATGPIPVVVPFSPYTWVAVGGDRIFVGDGGFPRIDVFGLDGALQRRIALDRRAMPVTRESYRRYLVRERGEVDSRVDSVLLAMRERGPLPEALPYFGDLAADTDGNVWVADYSPEYPAPTRWTVIHPAGRELGRATLPSGFRPLEIGRDYVLGVWKDAMNVEYVHLYALNRSPAN